MNEKIQDAIKYLSLPDSLKNACRLQEKKQPMPSYDVIIEIVKSLRAVIFPGYFGNSDINFENIGIHIEGHINKINELLISQIKSGVCFENAESDFNCD